MRTRGLLIFLVFSSVLAAHAQQAPLDSLLHAEKTYRKADTVRVKLLTDLARRYYAIAPVQGVAYAEEAILLAEKLGEKTLLAGAYSAKGTNKMGLAEYTGALDFYQKALTINEQEGNRQGVANNYNNIG